MDHISDEIGEVLRGALKCVFHLFRIEICLEGPGKCNLIGEVPNLEVTG